MLQYYTMVDTRVLLLFQIILYYILILLSNNFLRNDFINIRNFMDKKYAEHVQSFGE